VPAGVLPEDIFKPSSDPALMAVSLVTYENHLSLMKTLKLADLRLHFVNIFKATYKGFKSSAKLSELVCIFCCILYSLTVIDEVNY